MTKKMGIKEPETNTLCKACGLCCSGHLFAFGSLLPDETTSAQALGMTLQQSYQEKLGFTMPCPMWIGQCSIYLHPDKPKTCGRFECKKFKESRMSSSPA